MKYLLRDVIHNLEHAELMDIKKDIEKGGLRLKKLVEEQITENEKKHEAYCAVCASDIDPNSTMNFTVIFGPEGFKKKATFCAVDCLKYFISNLEQLKKGKAVKKVDDQAPPSPPDMDNAD